MEIWEKPDIEPIRIKVENSLIQRAKIDIKKIEDNPKKITNDGWRGLVAEYICSDLLKKAYPNDMEIEAQGISDEKDWRFDIQMAGVKIDVKCSTGKYYTICPMAANVKSLQCTTVYIGCKYLHNYKGHDVVEIYGSISRSKILECEEKHYHDKNHPFFEVHLNKMDTKILRKLNSNI